MTVSSMTVAKLNEERKYTAIIGTSAIREGKTLNERDSKIADAFRKFAVNTQKTSSEFVKAAKITNDFIRMSDAVTDREIMKVAHFLQSEKIGIVSRINKKGEYFYTRLDWSEFSALDITARVVTVDEQKKQAIERKAKAERNAKAKADANAREVLAKAGFSEIDIDIMMARADNQIIDVTPTTEGAQTQAATA